MDGRSLEQFLRYDKHVSKHFLGVFAADTLPRSVPKPALIIVNSDPISKAGTHWLAISIDSCGRGEYFDSYGIRPFVSEHEKFLSRVCKSWKYNHTDLQDLYSSVCGQYCAMYLMFKAHGYSLNEFVKCFTNNCTENDAIVCRMFERYSRNVKFCDDVTTRSNAQRCCKRAKK